MGGEGPAYDLFYLVTSVYAGEVREHKSFAWDAPSKTFVETALEVIDA